MALAALALPRLGAQASSRARKLAVTIDDGPAVGTGNDLAAFTRISDALREAFVAEKVPAIMFVNERQLNVEGQRDARVALLQRWLDAGLDLGNHAYAHLNLGEVGLDRFLDDIVKGEVITRPLLESRGKKLVWFRYPFLATGSGDTAAATESFLAKRGYRIAPVSVDYRDYSFATPYARMLRAGDQAGADQLLATVLKTLDESFARSEARSTEILGYELPQTLLIHCNEMNARTLRTALARMRDRGYTFVPLDEAMADPAYDPARLRPGGMGGGFLSALAAARREAPAK